MDGAVDVAAGSVDREGRAYGRPQATPDALLTQCGAGTPGGELLRRYWQPLALSSDATKFPVLVRILGEDLILFRTGEGVPGLLYPRCMHRGTTLLYGRVDEKGIRCCYHGWLFAPDGEVLEMACEPGAAPKVNARQPWYPLVERHGVIFTYMGPPEKQPAFPRFSVAEGLAEDETLVVSGGLKGLAIPDPNGVGAALAADQDYNWWQFHDNVLDPFHVYWVHARLNGVQFVDTYDILPKVTFEYTPDGVRSIQHRDVGGGKVHQRMGQSLLPNLNSITALNDAVGFGGLGWTVPVDDTRFRTFFMSRQKKGSNPFAQFMDLGIFKGWGPQKPAGEWTLEDHQTWQSDYVCQKGQGDITLHSEEHLSATDQGLAMFRRMWRREAEKVAAGGDPIGVTFDAPYLYRTTAANAVLDAATMEAIEGPDGRKY